MTMMTIQEINRRAFGADKDTDICSREFEEDELTRKWEAEEEAKIMAYLKDHPEEDDKLEPPFI